MPKQHKHSEYSEITKYIYIGTKNKIYVHCKNGHGRAPTLVAAYLIAQGMSIKEVIAFLISKRAGVNIRPAQLNALGKFKKEFSKSLS